MMRRERFDVWHEVPLVQQLTGMSCWAAAAAMIVGWRDSIDIDAEDVARGAGRWQAYRDGLEPGDVEAFARAWGLEVARPVELSVGELRRLISTCGPLWVGEASPGLHVIVVAGMYGEGTADASFVRIADPWPIGRGERYTISFREFRENLVAAATLAGGSPQILHAPRGARRASRAAYGLPPRRDDMTTQPEARVTVVIDPGHGGHGPAGRSSAYGTRGPNGTLEKHVNLDLARRVATHLGPSAILTRQRDENLPLGERCAVAQRSGARVFLSLHANDGPPGQRGTEIFVHSYADPRSRMFADALQRELVADGAPIGGTRSAELAVLTPDRLPAGAAACLIEVDYLSDAQGERRLRDPGQLDRLGASIARGVRRYLGTQVAHRDPRAEAMMLGATLSSLPAVPTGAPWTDLISFRPPTALQRAVKSREPTPVTNLWHMHKLEDALGPINLDRYEIEVSALPTLGGVAVTAEQLLGHIRLNINDVIDPSVARFSPYDVAIDGLVWRSFAPLGAVLHIHMLDDGSVLCARAASDHWLFSTIKAGTDGYHPVSGNRQFGFQPSGDGYVFYTRGADRASGVELWTAGDSVFSGGDELWRSFQRGVAALVNSNGGSATIGSRFSERFDWDQIMAAYHRPTESWI